MRGWAGPPVRTGLGKLGEEGLSASNLLFAVTPKKEEGCVARSL